MTIIDTWNKKEFLQVMSDVYKDAFGVRPNYFEFNKWSLEQLKEEFLILCQIAADNEQQEREQ